MTQWLSRVVAVLLIGVVLVGCRQAVAPTSAPRAGAALEVTARPTADSRPISGSASNAKGRVAPATDKATKTPAAPDLVGSPGRQPDDVPLPAKSTTIDLAPFGLPALIEVPAGAVVMAKRNESIEIRYGRRFHLYVDCWLEPSKPTFFGKDHFNRPKSSIVVDEAEGFVGCDLGVLSANYYLSRTFPVGARFAKVDGAIDFQQEVVAAEHYQRWWQSAKSLRQTEAQKKATAVRDAAVPKLRANPNLFVEEGGLWFRVICKPELVAPGSVWPFLKDITELISVDLTKLEYPQPDDVRDLAQVPNLCVEFFGRDTTDAVFTEFKGHKRLESITFYNTKVTTAGLKTLGTLKGVQNLVFEQGILASGLGVLSELAELRTIEIRDLAVTDRLIDTLINLPKLEAIKFEKTKVTPDGVARLKKAKPTVSVSLD